MNKVNEYKVYVTILFYGKTEEKALEILKWDSKFAGPEYRITLSDALDNIDVSDVEATGVKTTLKKILRKLSK